MESDTLFPEVFRATVHYSGRVQGVGFRYQTHEAAKEFDVAGCVRNLPDGRVELIAEGSQPAVNAFLLAVSNRMDGFIRKMERTDHVVVPTFSGFLIQ